MRGQQRHSLALVDPATGRIDRLRLADALGLTAVEVTAIARDPEDVPWPLPPPQYRQDRLRLAADIAAGLLELTGGDSQQAAIWLRAPHPELDDATPLELMRGSELSVIADLVDDMLSGSPS